MTPVPLTTGNVTTLDGKGHEIVEGKAYGESRRDSCFNATYSLKELSIMGQLFEFGCERCGYQAEVSGGEDAGYLIVTPLMRRGSHSLAGEARLADTDLCP